MFTPHSAQRELGMKAVTRRRLGATAAVLAAALTLSACSAASPEVDPEVDAGTPVVGGVINIAVSDEPTTLDATVTRSDITALYRNHMTEGLFALDAGFEPQPMLVDTYEINDDATQFVFTLRDGVTFHDGTALDSSDVLASLERFRENGTVGRSALSDVEMSAPDAQTVVLEFPEPQGNLLYALSDLQAPIYPSESLKDLEPGPVPNEKVIGTGPYKLERWTPGVEVILSRFDDYSPVDTESSGLAGEKVAYADELRIVAVPNVASRISAVESGEFQIGMQLGGDDAQLVDSIPNLTAVRKRLGKLMLIPNTTVPPFDNPDIRQAVLIGLNIEAFGQVLGVQENWNIYPSILPSDQPLASDAGAENFNRGDVEEAKRLLAEAGYDGTPVTIITASSSATLSQAVIMQEQLEGMGIPTTVEPLELTVLQARRGDPSSGWNMAGGQVAGQTDILQSVYLPCDNRQSYICDERIDAALTAFSQAIGPEARQAAYNRIQELTYEVVPVFLTTEFRTLVAVDDSLAGFRGDVEPVLWNSWVAAG